MNHAMIFLPRKADFLYWQIEHYRQRLTEEKRPEAIKFLISEIERLCNT